MLWRQYEACTPNKLLEMGESNNSSSKSEVRTPQLDVVRYTR